MNYGVGPSGLQLLLSELKTSGIHLVLIAITVWAVWCRMKCRKLLEYMTEFDTNRTEGQGITCSPSHNYPTIIIWDLYKINTSHTVSIRSNVEFYLSHVHISRLCQCL